MTILKMPATRTLLSTLVTATVFALAAGQIAAQTAAPPKVTVTPAITKDVSPETSFIARGEAIKKVDLVSRVTGFLDEQPAPDGSLVKTGDIVFQIEQDTYQAELEAQQANLVQTQANLENANVILSRDSKLVKDSTISQATYDTSVANQKVATGQVAAAQAAVKTAELNLGFTTVKAPFDGRLSRATVSLGALVDPSTGSLITLVQEKPMYVTFSISDKTMLQVMQQLHVDTPTVPDGGSKAIVKAQLADGNMLDEKGKIVFIDNHIDPDTGSLAIRAQFDNTEGLIFDGSFLNVIIQNGDPKRMIVIPQAAIGQDQRGSFVLVVDDKNTVEQRYITTGQVQGVDIIVKDGLREGENIIVDGLQKVRPGIPVDPVQATITPASADSGGTSGDAGSSGSSSSSSSSGSSGTSGAPASTGTGGSSTGATDTPSQGG
ncbi:efflux RND transporter periplasmic adaptor subunit [Chachezhania sediminis]|uniref:efflux RND transporter periplasmic adaptor subunit n=1 Tax=Chachezhania sediminis TaxID=2599291 RepID=UPI00131AD956|nr:efflux RND transporter periplasmic adaptor subunit [Chachezhania sediminis]